jgi:hypothetical protein
MEQQCPICLTSGALSRYMVSADGSELLGLKKHAPSDRSAYFIGDSVQSGRVRALVHTGYIPRSPATIPPQTPAFSLILMTSHPDGTVYMASRVDPVFLVLPSLLAVAGSVCYCCLY